MPKQLSVGLYPHLSTNLHLILRIAMAKGISISGTGLLNTSQVLVAARLHGHAVPPEPRVLAELLHHGADHLGGAPGGRVRRRAGVVRVLTAPHAGRALAGRLAGRLRGTHHVVVAPPGLAFSGVVRFHGFHAQTNSSFYDQ